MAFQTKGNWWWPNQLTEAYNKRISEFQQSAQTSVQMCRETVCSLSYLKLMVISFASNFGLNWQAWGSFFGLVIG